MSSRISGGDRDELLSAIAQDEYSQGEYSVEEVNSNILKRVLLIFAITIISLVGVIFIKNSIYYKSRQVNAMYMEYLTLQEENRTLHWDLESINHNKLLLQNEWTLQHIAQ